MTKARVYSVRQKLRRSKVCRIEKPQPDAGQSHRTNTYPRRARNARLAMRRLNTESHRASQFGIGLGLMLALGMAGAQAPLRAADQPPIVGDWEGTLDPGAHPKQRVVVHISQSEYGTLTGTIDYPDQDTSGIAITAITYKEPALHFESQPGLVSYDGTMNKDNSEISGNWKKGGALVTLVLKRSR